MALGLYAGVVRHHQRGAGKTPTLELKLVGGRIRMGHLKHRGNLVSRGVTGIIELLPGGTLVGLAKRGMRGVASIAVKTPDDLAAARELLA